MIGVLISFLEIEPIRLLFAASIAGGLGTPISLAFLLLVAGNRRIMGDERVSPALSFFGWGTAIMVTGVSIYFLWQQMGSLF